MKKWVTVLVLAAVCGCIQPGWDTTDCAGDACKVVVPGPTTPTTQSTSTTETTTTMNSATQPTLEPTAATQSTTTLNPLIQTFEDNRGEVCRADGKPVIRMYSKAVCHNCKWSEPIFDKVAGEYAEKGLIVAHHWIFDRNDDMLTEADEISIPDGEQNVFFDDETNPSRTVPYFNFGCRFTRVGNGYQLRNMPEREEAEYRALIEQLLAS